MNDSAQLGGAVGAGRSKEPMQPRPDGEISVATRDLDDAVNVVIHQLEQLADRLGPALRAPGPEVADISQKLTDGHSGVDVADAMWTQVHRLTVAGNRLRDLNDRVAL